MNRRHESDDDRPEVTAEAAPSEAFIERIEILDRQAFGRRVMEWSEGKVPVPKDLDEAEQQLTGILRFPLPSYITALNFIPTTKEVWTIKLPPPDMLQDTRNRIASPMHDYPLDPNYGKRVNGEFPNDAAFFEFRVGDYTCSLCT